VIRKLTIGAAVVSAALLTGCGSSSSSSSSAKYETLQDLEYKTLSLEEYWHTIKDETKNKTHSTMVFKERYTEGGYLVDEGSNTEAVRLCTVLEEGDYQYMCLTSFFKENSSTAKSAAMHIFNISDDDKVTGNFSYSPTANTEELAQIVSSRETAYAWITGTASATNTSNKTVSKLTKSLNNEQFSLSKINVENSNKLTQINGYLTAILNNMKSEISTK